MIDVGQFPCIIHIIVFLLALVSLCAGDSKKFGRMFLAYWVVSILMLFIYHTFNAGGC